MVVWQRDTARHSRERQVWSKFSPRWQGKWVTDDIRVLHEDHDKAFCRRWNHVRASRCDKARRRRHRGCRSWSHEPCSWMSVHQAPNLPRAYTDCCFCPIPCMHPPLGCRHLGCSLFSLFHHYLEWVKWKIKENIGVKTFPCQVKEFGSFPWGKS